MTENAVIRIHNLFKNYGDVRALRGVDLEVNRGEIFGFLGPNGAGKTTTIRCMLDLIRPNRGEINVLGFDPQQDSLSLRSKVGYLPGELSMESNLTVRGQLNYYRDLRGNHVDWNYVNQLAERFALGMKTPIKNLSKGNKQKIGVIQALMHRPELLILDEPTSGLDPLMQQEVYSLLKEIKAGGGTVFFSSHIINEVEALADRVAIIRNGAIAEETKPDRLAKMEKRRVRIRFKEQVDAAALARVKGVSSITQGKASVLTLEVEGELDALVKALGKYAVSDIDIQRTSLEEVFLTYYEDSKA